MKIDIFFGKTNLQRITCFQGENKPAYIILNHNQTYIERSPLVLRWYAAIASKIMKIIIHNGNPATKKGKCVNEWRAMMSFMPFWTFAIKIFEWPIFNMVGESGEKEGIDWQHICICCI